MTTALRPRFKDMMNLVVAADACCECGSCVAACPHRVMEMRDRKPAKRAGSEGASDHCGVSEGIGCDVCASVCPRMWPREPHLRDVVFGPQPAYEGIFGVYRHIFVARTRDAGTRERGQDGGVVTSLLAWARECGLIDGAVVASVGEGDAPCFPTPKIATTVEQIRDSAGSWYTYCPNNLALPGLAKAGVERAAFVGVPCQITALRKTQCTDPSLLLVPGKKPQIAARQRESMAGPGARVDFSIGLFCTEVFRPELMTERIAGEMGIALDQIERFNVKGEVLIHQRNGAVVTIPLETAMHEYQRPECAHCGDFAAELADISCGGVGTDFATIVVLRSQRGIDIWQAYEASGRVEVWPIQEHKKAWNILQRLARRQRERVPAASPGAVPVQHAAVAEAGTLQYSPHQHARAAQAAFEAAQPDPALREASLAAVYGPRAHPVPQGPVARSPIPGEAAGPGPDGKRKLPPPPGAEQGGASPAAAGAYAQAQEDAAPRSPSPASAMT